MKVGEKVSVITKVLALVILFIFYITLFVRPLDITSGDLGRHLTNGKIIVHSLMAHESVWPILHTNFYSYTEPNFPFMNHHWATGVMFYLLFTVSGWAGLQLFFTFISIVTIGIFMYMGTKLTNFWLSFGTTFFLLPLITERRMIRPELISYLFLGLVLTILWQYVEHKKSKFLWFAPLIFLLWVNFHIYFIFGFAVLGIFGIDSLVRRNWVEVKILALTGLASILAALVNPFGYKVLLYPFTILNNFGYAVVETLPLVKALSGTVDPNVGFVFKIGFVLFWLLFGAVLIKEPKRFDLKIFLLGLIFSGLAWQMLRNLAMFGLIFSVILTVILKDFWQLYDFKNKFNFTSSKILGFLGVVVIIMVAIVINVQELKFYKNIGFTPDPVHSRAAEFLKANHFSGNWLNDFSSGSYLLFYLYPEFKPYVDQRPEAYPGDFFVKQYTPLFRDEIAWHAAETKYDWQVIFLTKGKHPDSFVSRRKNDPHWKLVFEDEKYLIFARR